MFFAKGSSLRWANSSIYRSLCHPFKNRLHQRLPLIHSVEVSPVSFVKASVAEETDSATGENNLVEFSYIAFRGGNRDE
jgi:hypothetical protein